MPRDGSRDDTAADTRTREREPANRESAVVDRRRALGLLVAGAAGTLGGCARSDCVLRSCNRPEQVSLSIKSLPADADTRALRISRFLAENLDAIGVDASIVPMRRETLFRDVLMNHRFDIYVARFPERTDPDFLRSLVHSQYVTDVGWQNPFGFVDADVDELLGRQRRHRGPPRARAVEAVQRKLAHAQPFSVVAFVDEIRALRFEPEPTGRNVHTKLGYLSLLTAPNESVSGDDRANGEGSLGARADRRPDAPRAIRMTLTDERPLKNLNPLSVVFRGEGVITSLLYDSLGQRIAGQVRPWLAASWSWDEGNSDVPGLDVTLREDLRWHDGTALDAADVAFTYRFLSDTSLGTLDSPVPAPRFGGRASVVTDAVVLDDCTVRLSFRPVSRSVARRALTAPILPTHVWKGKNGEATVGGIDTGATVTEAVVWNNRTPVGSGPLQLKALNVRKKLSLEPFEHHFLTHVEAPHLRPFGDDVAYDHLTFQRFPSSESAVAMVRSGDADGTAMGVLPTDVPSIGKDSALDLHVYPSRSFYHVGYNARRPPLDDPSFRRAVARLLDEAFLVEDVFDGFAEPAASPLARHEMLAPELAWEGTDPSVPFLGEHGRLDVERARQALRDAGYGYGDDGKLRVS